MEGSLGGKRWLKTYICQKSKWCGILVSKIKVLWEGLHLLLMYSGLIVEGEYKISYFRPGTVKLNPCLMKFMTLIN